MNELFPDIALRAEVIRQERRAKQRAAIEALKSRHNIRTHHSDDLGWLAVCAFDPQDTRDAAELMAAECVLLEEAGRTFEAATEDEAVEGLLSRIGIKQCSTEATP